MFGLDNGGRWDKELKICNYENIYLKIVAGNYYYDPKSNITDMGKEV